MLIGGARTGCTNPLLFLGPAAQQSYQTRSCLIIYKLINFLLAPLILPLLVYSLVKEQESIKDLLKGKSIDISLEKLVGQKMKYCKSVQQALLSFKQHELALEMFIQIFIQLVMLMLNNTETATNTGLQAVFNKESAAEDCEDPFLDIFSLAVSGKWLGPTGFLVFSIFLTFISIVKTQIKIIKLGKNGFLPFTAKTVLAVKVFLSSVLRIIVFFFYFTPFLGLLNLLAHWKADQIPFTDIEFQNKSYTYWDQDNNNTSTVPFNKLHLTFPGSEPPHYSHYTVLRLGQAYLVFWLVLAVQLVVVLLTKQWLSQPFRQAGLGSKLLHGLHCLNIPDIFQDWDKQDFLNNEETLLIRRNSMMRDVRHWFPQNGHLLPVEMLRKRRQVVLREMGATQLFNWLFNMILLTPIYIAGIQIF